MKRIIITFAVLVTVAALLMGSAGCQGEKGGKAASIGDLECVALAQVIDSSLYCSPRLVDDEVREVPCEVIEESLELNGAAFEPKTLETGGANTFKPKALITGGAGAFRAQQGFWAMGESTGGSISH